MSGYDGNYGRGGGYPRRDPALYIRTCVYRQGVKVAETKGFPENVIEWWSGLEGGIKPTDEMQFDIVVYHEGRQVKRAAIPLKGADILAPEDDLPAGFPKVPAGLGDLGALQELVSTPGVLDALKSLLGAQDERKE